MKINYHTRTISRIRKVCFSVFLSLVFSMKINAQFLEGNSDVFVVGNSLLDNTKDNNDLKNVIYVVENTEIFIADEIKIAKIYIKNNENLKNTILIKKHQKRHGKQISPRSKRLEYLKNYEKVNQPIVLISASSGKSFLVDNLQHNNTMVISGFRLQKKIFSIVQRNKINLVFGDFERNIQYMYSYNKKFVESFFLNLFGIRPPPLENSILLKYFFIVSGRNRN